VNRYGSGSSFGEMALITNQRRKATVIARSKVRCLRLGRAAFEKLVGRCPMSLRSPWGLAP
jgi:CRP-like cAMP-binding protein